MSTTATDNRNFFIQGQFKVNFSGSKYGKLNFFSTSINHPGVNRNESNTPYRNEAGFTPGDRVEYEPVTVTILLDEELTVYDELLEWLTALKDRREDMSLTLMSSKNTPIREFVYRSVFPTSIGGFSLNSQLTEAEPISLDVTFRYDRFELKRVSA
jgi:hypothetical protein